MTRILCLAILMLLSQAIAFAGVTDIGTSSTKTLSQWVDANGNAAQLSGDGGGEIIYSLGYEAWSQVVDYGGTTSREITNIEKNVVGSGTGSTSIFYRTGDALTQTSQYPQWKQWSASDSHVFQDIQVMGKQGSVIFHDNFVSDGVNMLSGYGYVEYGTSLLAAAAHGWTSDTTVWIDGTYNRMYVFWYGYTASDGVLATYCSVYDYDLAAWVINDELVVTPQSSADNHHWFSFVGLSDGYILCAGGAHNQPPKLGITANAEDVTSPLTVTTSALSDWDSTYVQLKKRGYAENNDEVFMGFRGYTVADTDQSLRLFRATETALKADLTDWAPGIKLTSPEHDYDRTYIGKWAIDDNGDLHIPITWRNGNTDDPADLHDVWYMKLKYEYCEGWANNGLADSSNEHWVMLNWDPSNVQWDDAQLTEATGTNCDGTDELSDNEFCYNSSTGRLYIQNDASDYDPTGNDLQAYVANEADGTEYTRLPVVEGDTVDYVVNATKVLASCVALNQTGGNIIPVVGYMQETSTGYFTACNHKVADWETGVGWDVNAPTAATTMQAHIQVVVDGEANIWAYADKNGDVTEFLSDDGGDTWSETTIHTTNSSAKTAPSVTISDDNQISILFSDGHMAGHIFRNPVAYNGSNKTWTYEGYDSYENDTGSRGAGRLWAAGDRSDEVVRMSSPQFTGVDADTGKTYIDFSLKPVLAESGSRIYLGIATEENDWYGIYTDENTSDPDGLVVKATGASTYITTLALATISDTVEDASTDTINLSTNTKYYCRVVIADDDTAVLYVYIDPARKILFGDTGTDTVSITGFGAMDYFNVSNYADSDSADVDGAVIIEDLYIMDVVGS